MTNDPLRSSDIKLHNRNMVLSLVYHFCSKGGISQAEVVERTSLKAPTVFRIFTSLEQEGFIKQVESESVPSSLERKKGRRPVFYTVIPDACYIVSVEFWASCVSLGIFNFEGKRIYSNLSSLLKESDAEDVVNLIIKMTEDSIALNRIPKSKILGVGIAGPGRINLKEGSIVYYGKIAGMVNFPLKKRLSDALNVPVIIHNNCCAMAYYTYNHLPYSNKDSVFTYLFRGGVNGSLVTEDGIYVTADKMTFEAGHIPLDVRGPKCWCGVNGCLQALLSELDNCFRGDDENYSNMFSTLEEPLTNNNPKAVETIDKIAFYVFSSMKQIKHTLAPASFQIICSSIFVSEAIASRVRYYFNNDKDNFFPEKPDIFTRAYDNILAQEGMLNLVLNDFFEGKLF